MVELENTKAGFSSAARAVNRFKKDTINNNEREIIAIERISVEIYNLRAELAAERQRAEKAEASNKRYALYFAVISGIISSVVSVFLSYLVLR